MASENGSGESQAAGSGGGRGELQREKGIYIMRLEGTYAEMGGQMADLARGVVDDLCVRYYRGLIEKLVAHSQVGAISRVIPPRAAGALYSLFYRANRSRLGSDLEECVVSFYKGLGLDPRGAPHTMLFGDILHYLAGKALAPMAMPGCSGFFARDSATKDGKIVVGRNFDFFGRGVWNANQAFLVVKPPDAQPYLWVSSLGIPFGGFGINKYGIGLMPFTNFSSDVSIRGKPFFPIFIEILETATCLDDVVRIVGREPRIAALSMLAVDTSARDACVVGFSASKMELLYAQDDFIVRTNNYVTDEMKQIEVAPSAWFRHSNARYVRLEQQIKEQFGELTPESAVSVMSDMVDPYEGRERVVGDILAAVNNAMSLVFSPEDDAIYLADGDYPLCHSDAYLGFRLSALFERGARAALDHDLPGSKKLSDTEKQAVFHYEEAWSEFFDRFDSAKAVFHLRRAAEIMPDEPIFHRIAGLILLKEGRYSQALLHLEVNSAPDYRERKVKAEALLWVGRCYDLLGMRPDALRNYGKAFDLDDPEISPCAERHLLKPFTKGGLAGLEIEFVTGDPLAKYR